MGLKPGRGSFREALSELGAEQRDALLAALDPADSEEPFFAEVVSRITSLAANESPSEIAKRFAKAGIPVNPKTVRKYIKRGQLITAASTGEHPAEQELLDERRSTVVPASPSQKSPSVPKGPSADSPPDANPKPEPFVRSGHAAVRRERRL